jgi:hypothetical protein
MLEFNRIELSYYKYSVFFALSILAGKDWYQNGLDTKIQVIFLIFND